MGLLSRRSQRLGTAPVSVRNTLILSLLMGVTSRVRVTSERKTRLKVMGVSSSRIEEDKALQLCRERKKFVRQALDGRCSLAAIHIAYIEALKSTGTALRKFVEPEALVESFIYTSTNSTLEPHALREKDASQFSFSSTSRSQRMDTTSTISPSPSPPTSSSFQTNYMKFRGTFSRKVEEKPSLPVTVSIISSTSEKPLPHSPEKPETSPYETPPFSPRPPPWDFFGLPHSIDNHFSSQEGMEFNQPLERGNKINQLKEEERISELENEEEKLSSKGKEELQESEDEFEEPTAATLVRSFENVNRTTDPAAGDLPATPSAESVTSEIKCLNGEKIKSSDLSPLRATCSGVAILNDIKRKPIEEDDTENKVAPKDLFSNMKDIEQLFSKASDSGREVPRMLEANKFHFRPILPGKERGSMGSSLLKSCFSCGEDPSQVQEGPPQTSVKYLTWHCTTSSLSSSSGNPLGANPLDDIEDFTSNIFDNFCMTAGSHASTLDRLYAWEKKLYDEVKASEMVRREYDLKCKLLRQLESREESRDKIDKTRAVVKDLHSRIRVAIHRIDTISKKIEELRDKELQPQLEELIEGLRRMWEAMFECHKRQFHIISISHTPGKNKISIQSDSRRQITIHLQNELSILLSSFTKWIGAQKTYVEAINKWLLKCVSLAQKSSRRKRRMQPPPLWKYGPPIYVICGVWFDMFDNLPTKEVVDSIKALAAEVSHFLPHQEKNQGKGLNGPHSTSWQAGMGGDDPNVNMLTDEPSEDRITGFDHFHTSLAAFLGQLNKFAESSVTMYTELQKEIQEAKNSYQQSKSSS